MRGRLILILADIIIPGIVTLIGFASHSSAGSADASLLSTFLLLLASWFLVAPFLGVYNLERVKDIKQIGVLSGRWRWLSLLHPGCAAPGLMFPSYRYLWSFWVEQAHWQS
jgi:hypothetical protein